ncbi:MAG: histidine kinase [Bacteroidota bacterium]
MNKFSFVVMLFSFGLPCLHGQTPILQQVEDLYDLMDVAPPEVALEKADSLLGNVTELSNTERAHLWILKSDAYYFAEDTYASTEAMHKAIQLMPEDFPILKKAEALNNFGQNLASLGFPDSAISIYQEALRFARQGRDTIQMGNIFYNIGVEYKTQSDYQNCLNYWDSAYQMVLISQDSTSVGHTLRAIGYLNSSYGNHAEARESYRKALHYITAEDPQLRCVILTALGDSFYQEKSMLDSCLYYIEEAESCYASAAHQNNLSYLYKLQAKYYLAIQDTLNGIKFLAKTQAYAQVVGDYEEYLSSSFFRLAVDSAYRYEVQLPELLKEVEKRNMLEQLSVGYDIWGDLLFQKGEFAEASRAYQKSIQLNKDFAARENQRILQEQSARFDLQEKENQIQLLELTQALEREANNRKINTWVTVFSVVLLLSVGGSLFTLYRSRKSKLQLREAQLRHEKQLFRQLTEAKSQAFRAQMNPHFIFNSLNSIKGLVVGQRNKEAMFYISKFSKLVRLVLEYSQREQIPLEEELKMLELYLTLEKLRFRDGFEHQVIFEGPESLKNYMIPPICIQPFTENAIWHGFKQNPRPNQLTISVHDLSKDFFQITITDNGVGRKREQNPHRKSYGVDITRKRLAYFSGISSDEVIQFTDLKNEQEALGTKVTLKLKKHDNSSPD